jgi:hypothetical protein
MELALARLAADQLAQQGARIDNFQLQAPLEQLPHGQGKAVEPRVAGGTIKAKLQRFRKELRNSANRHYQESQLPLDQCSLIGRSRRDRIIYTRSSSAGLAQMSRCPARRGDRTEAMAARDSGIRSHPHGYRQTA